MANDPRTGGDSRRNLLAHFHQNTSEAIALVRGYTRNSRSAVTTALCVSTEIDR